MVPQTVIYERGRGYSGLWIGFKGLYSRVYGTVDEPQFGGAATGSMHASAWVSRQIGTLRPRNGN